MEDVEAGGDHNHSLRIWNFKVGVIKLYYKPYDQQENSKIQNYTLPNSNNKSTQYSKMFLVFAFYPISYGCCEKIQKVKKVAERTH